MDEFASNINEFLVGTFRTILKVEEKVLANVNRHDLSISELHLIETVGKRDRITISQIAENLNITLPSVTVAINKLFRKGYVDKIKSDIDGRAVWVVLTDLGKKINDYHTEFHNNLVESIGKAFSEDEREKLFNLVKKLDNFFKTTLENGV